MFFYSPRPPFTKCHGTTCYKNLRFLYMFHDNIWLRSSMLRLHCVNAMLHRLASAAFNVQNLFEEAWFPLRSRWMRLSGCSWISSYVYIPPVISWEVQNCRRAAYLAWSSDGSVCRRRSPRRNELPRSQSNQRNSVPSKIITALRMSAGSSKC